MKVEYEMSRGELLALILGLTVCLSVYGYSYYMKYHQPHTGETILCIEVLNVDHTTIPWREGEELTFTHLTYRILGTDTVVELPYETSYPFKVGGLYEITVPKPVVSGATRWNKKQITGVSVIE